MRVLPLAILSLIIVSAMAANTCKIFNCGNIQQTEGSVTCVKKQDNEEPTFRTQKCENKDHFCQAFNWNSPDQSTDTAECAAAAPPTTFPIPTPTVANAGFDGDFCDVVANCHVTEKNAATCAANVCTAVTKADSDCDDVAECPMGFSCTTKKCTALKAAGTVCANQAECVYSTTCVTVGEETDKKCTAANSLADGVTFVLATVSHEALGAEPAGSALCTSRFEFTVEGKQQCRAANRNTVQKLAGRTTDEAGQTCAYRTFNTATIADFATAVDVTSSSKCGFNKDNKAY